MTHDLIVIGAGPAGISAALMASSIGLKTLLLEEQARPGGPGLFNARGLPRGESDVSQLDVKWVG